MILAVILPVTGGTTIFVVVCSLAAWWQGQRPGGDEAGLWYGIVPPLSAIILAFVTRRVLFSLAFAMFLGGLLLHVPGNPTSIDAWGSGLYAAAVFLFDAVKEPANLQILLFVPPMFAMVLIIAEAGGFDGVLVHVFRIVKGRRSAQFATASAGVLYFFDDYSNAMVVGSAMRPMTDRYRISREKLAFLVDSTSAPIASLALISTWIMYEAAIPGEVPLSGACDGIQVLGLEYTQTRQKWRSFSGVSSNRVGKGCRFFASHAAPNAFSSSSAHTLSGTWQQATRKLRDVVRRTDSRHSRPTA